MAPGHSALGELTHRYSFETDARDSAGDAHGTLEGTAAVFDGAAYLDGTAGSYINLPPGLISGYSAVTIETWAVLSGSGAWSRLFDIGDTNPDTGNGRNYLFVTPRSGSADTRLVISDADPGYNHEEMVAEAVTLDDGNGVHVAAVVDDSRTFMALYINGRLVASRSDLTISLSDVATNAAYIGRSLYAPDAYLPGAIDEFRVHNAALGSAAIAASFASGPDAPSYDAGPASSLTLALPATLAVGASATPELAAVFGALGEIPLTPAEVTLSSSSDSVLRVGPNNTLTAAGPGVATITARIGDVTATAEVAVEAQPAILRHRYSFSENAGATEVADSVGDATGYVYPSQDGANEVAFSEGRAVFPGGAGFVNGAYIDLPDYLVSVLPNVTFETWFTWRGPAGSSWQRIFDFGSSAKGDNPHNPGGGTTSIYLTPRSGDGVVRFNAWPGTTPEAILTGPSMVPIDEPHHAVAIYAPEYGTAQLWIDGVMVASGPASVPLAAYQDINNWLGVSNWDDAPFNGEIDEFRIYEGVLTELEIALRRQAGPDTLPSDPGALESLSSAPLTLHLGNPASARAVLLADFANMDGVDVGGLSSAEFDSSDTNVFTVAANGSIVAVAAGEAEVVARYGGLTSTSSVTVLAPTALTLEIPSPLIAGGPPSSLVATAVYADTNLVVTSFPGVAFESDDPSIAAVNAAGAITPLRAGSTTLTATFAGQSASAQVTVAAPQGDAPELIHRYSFNGAPGSVVIEDSVGDADGELVNPSDVSALTGNGRLALPGGAWNGDPQGGYVNLPNGLVSGLESVTLEAWIRWSGPADSSWQRIFDFGRNAAVDGEGNPAEDQYANEGAGYMFLSPRSGSNTLRFAIKEGNGPETPVIDAPPVPVGVDTHVAVAYDTALGAVRLYMNGQRVGLGAASLPLSVVEDINVYLGRSQWTDSYFAGEFDEFRVYQGALSDEAVAASFAAGPDSLPDTTPRPQLTVELSGNNLILSWPAGVSGFTLESNDQVAGDNWTAVEGVENNSVTVPVTQDAARFFRLRN